MARAILVGDGTLLCAPTVSAYAIAWPSDSLCSPWFRTGALLRLKDSESPLALRGDVILMTLLAEGVMPLGLLSLRN